MRSQHQLSTVTLVAHMFQFILKATKTMNKTNNENVCGDDSKTESVIVIEVEMNVKNVILSMTTDIHHTTSYGTFSATLELFFCPLQIMTNTTNTHTHIATTTMFYYENSPATALGDKSIK